MVTRFNKTRKRNAAFTLIEMLVAVLIMGILLAVAIPLYLSSVKNAYDTTAQNNIKTLATAAAAYRVKNSTYPATMTVLTTPVPAGSVADVTDPSATPISYTVTGTASDVVIVATAAAGTFTTGTKWTYDAATGVMSAS